MDLYVQSGVYLTYCSLTRQQSSVKEAAELGEKEKNGHEKEKVEYETKISEGKVTEDGRSTNSMMRRSLSGWSPWSLKIFFFCKLYLQLIRRSQLCLIKLWKWKSVMK